MNNTIARSSLAALALVGMLATVTAAPARADGAATTRTIIAGLAAAAAIATIVNVSQKDAAANRVAGYLPDGSTVYADGRVVARNGYAWYPGNNGETVSCNGQRCYLSASNGNYAAYGGNYGSGYNGAGYYGNGYGGYAAPVYGSANVYSGANYDRAGNRYDRNRAQHAPSYPTAWQGRGQAPRDGHWQAGNGSHGHADSSAYGQPANGAWHGGGDHHQHS